MCMLPKALIYFHLDINDLGVIFISYVGATSGSEKQNKTKIRQDTHLEPFIKPYFSSPYQLPLLYNALCEHPSLPQMESDGTSEKRDCESKREHKKDFRGPSVWKTGLSLHSAAHGCVSLQRCASGETWNKPSIHPHLPLYSYSPSLVPPHGLSVLCSFSSPAGWRRRVCSGRVFNHFNYVLMQRTSPPR